MLPTGVGTTTKTLHWLELGEVRTKFKKKWIAFFSSIVLTIRWMKSLRRMRPISICLEQTTCNKVQTYRALGRVLAVASTMCCQGTESDASFSPDPAFTRRSEPALHAAFCLIWQRAAGSSVLLACKAVGSLFYCISCFVLFSSVSHYSALNFLSMFCVHCPFYAWVSWLL